jgi:hypothetical protein
MRSRGIGATSGGSFAAFVGCDHRSEPHPFERNSRAAHPRQEGARRVFTRLVYGV